MTNEMRILTVRQPYAWAIIHGGKDVENRVRNIAGGYRGPVAIHAGAQYDRTADSSPGIQRMAEHWGVGSMQEHLIGYGHQAYRRIIGVVDLRATHHAEFCADEPELCGPWAEPGEVWHLELTHPRQLPVPIPYRGALGMRRLDEETTAAVWSQIG